MSKTSGTSLSRRELLPSLAVATLLLNARGEAVAQNGLPAQFIDVHCHLFNGRDVPSARYILHVVAREQGFENYAKVAAFFVRLVTRFAPTAESEKRKLTRRGLSGTLADDMELTDERLQDFVLQTLRELKSTGATTPFSSLLSSSLIQDLEALGVDATADSFSHGSIPLNPEGAALAYLAEQYGQPVPLLPDTRLSPLQRSRGGGLNFSSLSDRALRDLSRMIVADASVSGSAVGAYLSFAKSFLCYRATNLDRIDKSLGLAAQRKSSLYIPLLVDFDLWVGANDSTSLAVQTALMAIVSKRAKPAVLMNGFVPFDPLRAVGAKLGKMGRGPDPLQVVRNAICSDGFIGVKVYPPMGFRALGNGELISFGPRADKLARDWGITSQTLGVELDAALARLYVFCVRNEIPILTHCSNSQTTFEGSGLRSDPAYWHELLSKGVMNPADSSMTDCSSLRLNLGHFGSIWCHASKPSGPDELARCTAAGVAQWPEKIVEMAEKFPNVYFDLADVAVLSEPAAGSTTLSDFMNGVLSTPERRKAFGSKFLYGTDWMFLVAAAAKTYGNFPKGLGAFVQSMGATERDVFWANAARYLGMTTYGMTTARLREFYKGDTARLNTLEALIVPDVDRANTAALACPL